MASFASMNIEFEDMPLTEDWYFSPRSVKADEVLMACGDGDTKRILHDIKCPGKVAKMSLRLDADLGGKVIQSYYFCATCQRMF